MIDIAILKSGDDARAEALSKKYGFGIIASAEEADGLYLTYEGDALTLTDGELSVCGDFTKLEKRLSTKNLATEALVKAATIKGQKSVTVIDATAGLGEDSLLLAAAGMEVHMFEYDRVIFALLEDAVRRAADIPALRPAISRMRLHFENSVEAMQSGSYGADAVFLDPMFPERQKSALIKKKFQLLQKLESPCEDGEALFSAALAVKPKRIIVKRPQKGERLTDKKPSFVIEGSSVRYDCYLPANT